MSRPFNLCLRIVGAVHLNDNGSLVKKILIFVAQIILKDGSHVLTNCRVGIDGEWHQQEQTSLRKVLYPGPQLYLIFLDC